MSTTPRYFGGMDENPISGVARLREWWSETALAPFVWLLVVWTAFGFLLDLSTWVGLRSEPPSDYHPVEAGWTYDDCLRAGRGIILDRNPDMVDLPDDLEMSVRQECGAHSWQHVHQ